MNFVKLVGGLFCVFVLAAVPGVLLQAASEVEGGAKAETKAETSLKEVTKAIQDKLTVISPNLKVEQISETPVVGTYQVELGGGQLIYATKGGSYFFTGDLISVVSGQMVNITDGWRSEQRVSELAKLNDEDLVVYPAKGEEQGVVYVFTDVSCGYCVKFHQEVPDLNALGITVKYVAWPRGGLQSKAGQEMELVWCAKDRLDALTKSKTKQPLPEGIERCETAIEEQIVMGQNMGVRGTPAIFLQDGRQLGGYVPYAQLAASMGIK